MITAALVKSTPNVLLYLLSQDGLDGVVAFVLPNATMAADLSGGPLAQQEGLGIDVAGVNTQAVSRKFMLGDGANVDLNHSQCSIQGRQSINNIPTGWSVDADIDAVSAQRSQLRIISDNNAADAYLRIEFEHSLTR